MPFLLRNYVLLMVLRCPFLNGKGGVYSIGITGIEKNHLGKSTNFLENRASEAPLEVLCEKDTV